MNDRAHLRHYREQERLAGEYADNLPQRQWDAREALEDEAKLKAVLNDEALAAPLARMFRNLDLAFKGDVDARDAVLQSVEAIRKQCYDWLMEDK